MIINKNLKYFVLEAFLVVLGVFLAFSITEWRKNIEKKELADHAFKIIKEEIITNKKKVEKSLDYHLYLLDTLKVIIKKKEKPGYRVFYKGFFRSARILSTAWEAAKISGTINYFEYENILKLSELYDMQHVYNVQLNSISNVFYDRVMQEGNRYFLNNFTRTRDIILAVHWTEKRLIQLYAKTLDSIN